MNSIDNKDKCKRWIAVYLGAVSCLLVPLYMKNGYISLIYWKARAFLFLAVPAFVIAAIITASSLIFHNNADIKSLLKRPKTSHILLLMIGLWALFSTLLSTNPELSLMGTAGWSMGSLMIALLTASTFFVSRYFEFRSYMLLPVIAVNAVIILFAVFQSAGVDFFGYLSQIDPEYIFTYLSTIGQKNCFSGYLCLLLPLFWGAFISCKGRAAKLLYGGFSFLGFMGIIVAESDSFYAGIGICVPFMLLYIFRSEQHFKRAQVLLVMYGISILIVRYLPVFENKTKRYYHLSKIMLHSPVAEILIIAGVLLYLFGGKIISGKPGKYLLIAIEAGLLISIVLYAAHTAAHFNDNWGTWRGRIWRVSWEQFLKFPLRNKIIGIGPEMLITVYGELESTFGMKVVSSHCEPLQVLLTQGIIGFGLYFIYWGYIIKLFFIEKLWTKNTAVFFFPLAAYLGQSVFCSVYPVTAVLFSFLSGIYLRSSE